MSQFSGAVRNWKHTKTPSRVSNPGLSGPLSFLGFIVFPLSLQSSHTLPPGALAPGVCGCVCMCARAFLSPRRYCTLRCRAMLYSLDVLCLYSHWSLWMETPLLNLFSELVYLCSLSRFLSLYISFSAFKWCTAYHLHTPICRSFAPPLCFYPTGMNKECIDCIPGLSRSKTRDCMDLLSRQLTHFGHALLTDNLENC